MPAARAEGAVYRPYVEPKSMELITMFFVRCGKSRPPPNLFESLCIAMFPL
ncbi:hypothetical protein CCP2SC5_1980002 [Azospirillaceae bacterium]